MNISLETRSQKVRRQAPPKALQMRRVLLAVPTSLLMAWGTMRPTKPMIPARLTLMPARPDASISRMIRILLTLRPRL